MSEFNAEDSGTPVSERQATPLEPQGGITSIPNGSSRQGVQPPETDGGNGPAVARPAGRVSDQKQRPCPACGHKLPLVTRYCPACGVYLNPPADRRKRQTQDESRWNIVYSCIMFYCLYLATLIPIAWLPANVHATAQMVIAFVDAAIILAFWRHTRYSARDAFKVNMLAGGYTVLGLILLVPMLALNFLYHGTLIRWFQVTERGLTEAFLNEGYGVGTIVFFICVMPAIWEEIAFRGLLQTRLEQVVRSNEALLLSSLLFAIIHCSALSLVYLLIMGVFLGVLRAESGSLVPGMVAHFVHNLIVVGYELSQRG